jgi:hypothetical protein
MGGSSQAGTGTGASWPRVSADAEGAPAARHSAVTQPTMIAGLPEPILMVTILTSPIQVRTK